MADRVPRPGAPADERRPLLGSIARPLEALRRIHSRRRASEVFPWLEHSTASLAIVGAVVAFGLGRAYGLGVGAWAFGAVAGAVGGAWLALGWASVGPPGPAARDLWDPWLDRGLDGGVDDPGPSEAVVAIVEDESEAEVAPEPVRIRPRAFGPDGGESLPLEDRVGPILAAHDRGAIRISGPDGSGKSTALLHLARLVPPHLSASFLDNPDPSALLEASERGLVVFATPHNLGGPKPLADLRLAPWGRDERIDYLLAGDLDRDRCASVMGRLAGPDAGRDFLGGIPELWAIVLDRMAEDGSIEGPRRALRIELERRFDDPARRELIEGDCLVALVVSGGSWSRADCLLRHDPGPSLFRLIRHRPVQLLLAADRIAVALAKGEECPALGNPLPRDLVAEAALRIGGWPEAVEGLRRLVDGPDEVAQPTAASLLHALGDGSRPGRPAPRMKGAYLEKANWAGIVLDGADLREAELGQSNLWGARLDRARLDGAQLSGSDLRNASLNMAGFHAADLELARLGEARAEGAKFNSARLVSADLEGAILDRAIFHTADLGHARLSGASLVGADLSRARIEGADFSLADLSGAHLSGVRLVGARFEGANFEGADMTRGDLEGLVLPGAHFSGANFSRALLTGSSLPGANLRAASFRGAGLADVDWEGADLRGADFWEASFHLGSSRSGLVGSPIASEGSRTGFYTDDFNDQDFKSPEEIRKANLRGVDLRGAKVSGVDFYLVDLRDARLDPAQIDHLRRSGAILESRA